MDSLFALIVLLVSMGTVSASIARTAEEQKSAEMPAEARSDNTAEQSIRNVGYESDFPPLANYYAAAYNHLPHNRRSPGESDAPSGHAYFSYDYPISNYYSNIYDYFPQVYGPLGYYFSGYSGIFGPIPYPYGFYRTSYESPLTAIDSLELYRSGDAGRADPVIVPPAETFKLPKKNDRS